MKKLLGIFAVLAVLTGTAKAQIVAVPYSTGVKTQAAYNLTKEIGSSVTATTTQIAGKYLVGIVINTSAVSDTIRVSNGSTQVAAIMLGSTASGVPVFVPYYCGIASDSIMVYKKGASDLTIIYRTAY